jgi:hypothetical protein
MPQPICAAHIQQFHRQWFLQKFGADTLSHHQITIGFHADKISHVFAAIIVQNNITSDFGNILVFNQDVCVGRLYRVIGFANTGEFLQRTLFTSSFVIFSSHFLTSEVFPNFSQKLPQNLPKMILKAHIPKNFPNPMFLGGVFAPKNSLLGKLYVIG